MLFKYTKNLIKNNHGGFNMFTRQKFLIAAITTVLIGSFAIPVMAGDPECPCPSSKPPTIRVKKSRTKRKARIERMTWNPYMWKDEREGRLIIHEEWRRTENPFAVVRKIYGQMFLQNLYRWILNTFFSFR